MSFPFHLLLFILPVLSIVIVGLVILYKNNGLTELYSQGVRNENEGRYNVALHNYEDALSEVRKFNLNKKFDEKIAQRIKILRSTIDFEKNFQDSPGS